MPSKHSARHTLCSSTDNDNTDAIDWRCKDCVENGLEADFRNVPEILINRRRSSAPKMARDLLPSARGGIKPDSHSVFNTLILDEDPMDGSRSLRKRKTPSAEVEEPVRGPGRKRRRTEEPEAEQHEQINGEANDEGEVAVSGMEGAAEDAESPKSRTGRPLRHLKPKRRGAWVVTRDEDPKSLVMGFNVSTAQWDHIDKEVQKKQRRRERDRQRRARNTNRRTATAEPEEVQQHFPAVQTSMYNNPFYAFPDRETDEGKGKPYGGILTDAEAETARTYPLDADRHAFQHARDKAEQAWKDKQAALNAETPAVTARVKASQSQASKIKCINFGQFEIDTWHAAPYPEEYSRNKHLYICEFCLKYMSSDYVAWRHKLKCSAKHPPGDEIYRSKMSNPETGTETALSFWEVDGRKNALYCQNLCLLAKLFLGSKTLYYGVEPFLFYIMTENDEFGCHFVGYFSKEKRGLGPPPPPEPRESFNDEENEGSQQANGGAKNQEKTGDYDPALGNPGNNVSCILVLPVHMRRGFGRVLIEFSYLLTKVEGRTGSPEKPLSDMGLVSYRSYWRNVLCTLLLRYKESASAGTISIAQIARETGMTPDDIISTLEALRFLVRDPVTKKYALRLDYEYMREYVEKHERKGKHVQLDPEKLVWTPYVMGRPTNLFAIGEEANAPMQTVAPREEEDEGPAEVATAQVDGSVDEVDSGHVETTEKVDGEEDGSNNAEQALGASPELKKKTPPAGFALTPRPSVTGKPEASPGREQRSPSRRSPRKTPNGTRLTANSASPSRQMPQLDGQQGEASEHQEDDGEKEIPPTRFEIFPPVPGLASASKRKPGRPPRGGSRRSFFGTPVRRSATARRTASRASEQRSSPNGAGNVLRRTRSKLGDVLMTADEDETERQQVRGAADDDVAIEEDMEDGVKDVIDEGGEEDAEGEEDDEIRYE